MTVTMPLDTKEVMLIQLITIALLAGSCHGWVPVLPLFGRRSTLWGSRLDDLVGMDAMTETSAEVDRSYYSVPPTEPQLLFNTGAEPRITLTRFLSNVVKEDPGVNEMLTISLTSDISLL